MVGGGQAMKVYCQGGVVTKVFIQHSEYEKGVRHLYNVDGILSLSNSNSSIYTHGFIFCMKELI